jgi:hypothetical protein
MVLPICFSIQKTSSSKATESTMPDRINDVSESHEFGIGSFQLSMSLVTSSPIDKSFSPGAQRRERAAAFGAAPLNGAALPPGGKLGRSWAWTLYETSRRAFGPVEIHHW